MPEKMPKNLVPARYIGIHPVELGSGKIHWNIDGTRRKRDENTLSPGDTIMMTDEDVLGKTILEDPHHNNMPIQLGIGRVVLPEHQGKSLEELDQLGYVWHSARPDFIPINPDASIEPPSVEGTLERNTTDLPTESTVLLEPPAQQEQEVI